MGQEIQEHLFQPLLISDQMGIQKGFHGAAVGDAPFFCFFLEQLVHFLQRSIHIEFLAADFQVPVLDVGQFLHIFDHGHEIMDFLLAFVHIFLPPLGIHFILGEGQVPHDVPEGFPGILAETVQEFTLGLGRFPRLIHIQAQLGPFFHFCTVAVIHAPFQQKAAAAVDLVILETLEQEGFPVELPIRSLFPCRELHLAAGLHGLFDGSLQIFL